MNIWVSHVAQNIDQSVEWEKIIFGAIVSYLLVGITETNIRLCVGPNQILMKFCTQVVERKILVKFVNKQDCSNRFKIVPISNI